MFKNVLHIKSTLLGVLFVGLSFYFIDKLTNVTFYALNIFGVSLVLIPDNTISILKKVLNKKSKDI